MLETTYTITELPDLQNVARTAMTAACHGNLRARAKAGELLDQIYFLHRKDFASAVLKEANRLAAQWFAELVHGKTPGELVELGVMAVCLYHAYDAIMEALHAS